MKYNSKINNICKKYQNIKNLSFNTHLFLINFFPNLLPPWTTIAVCDEWHYSSGNSMFCNQISSPINLRSEQKFASIST